MSQCFEKLIKKKKQKEKKLQWDLTQMPVIPKGAEYESFA